MYDVVVVPATMLQSGEHVINAHVNFSNHEFLMREIERVFRILALSLIISKTSGHPSL